MYKEWENFYFEGNQAWGLISNKKEWQRIKEAYKGSGVDLSRARRNPNRNIPAFGFYSEYTSDDKLGKFAEIHDMDIR